MDVCSFEPPQNVHFFELQWHEENVRIGDKNPLVGGKLRLGKLDAPKMMELMGLNYTYPPSVLFITGIQFSQFCVGTLQCFSRL